MKPTVILTAALLCGLSLNCFGKPLKVFILAGQSNMEGHAGIQTLDQLGEHPTHGHLLKKINNDDGSFVVRDDVLVSYQKADEKIKRLLSVGMGAWGADWFGPELMFGIEMGDRFKEPVLLIKTCWGGHSLYGNFRPPSAGKAGYDTGHKQEDIGASYHKMVKEVRECPANLDTDFPQLKEQMKDKPESADPKKTEQLVQKAGDKALKDDAAYQKAKQESDRHVRNWYCHYQGSARVCCMVGYSLGEAMKPLLTTKP